MLDGFVSIFFEKPLPDLKTLHHWDKTALIANLVTLYALEKIFEYETSKLLPNFHKRPLYHDRMSPIKIILKGDYDVHGGYGS